jgi:hypothetical protein
MERILQTLPIVFYNVDGYNLGIQAKEYIIPIRKPKK